MKLVIVRHGKTNANIINNSGKVLYTGNLNNELTDLTKEGIESAKKLAELEEIKQIQKVYCSDINRAIDTAKYAKPGFELNIDKRLRERDVGIFAGKYKEDLLQVEEYKKYVLDENYNKFRADFIQKAPKGENYTDVTLRTKEFLDSLDFDEDITVGIFSHGHCIKCMLLNLFKIEPKEKIFKLHIKNCKPYVIEVTNNSKSKFLSHNLEDLYKT